jgi:hypothetical protein
MSSVCGVNEEIERLRAENARLRAALEHYADPKRWGHFWTAGGATDGGAVIYVNKDRVVRHPDGHESHGYDGCDVAREALDPRG